MKMSQCPNCSNDVDIKTFGFGTLVKANIECFHCGSILESKTKHNGLLNAVFAALVTQLGKYLQPFFNIDWKLFMCIYIILILAFYHMIDSFKTDNIILELANNKNDK